MLDLLNGKPGNDSSFFQSSDNVLRKFHGSVLNQSGYAFEREIFFEAVARAVLALTALLQTAMRALDGVVWLVHTYAACLDIVAHEYTHGVTDYSSDLVYSFESGALNESFSDIMGATAEFYWYPEGIGLYKSDWYIGEDARSYYSTSGCRDLANPNSNSQLGDSRYPDPCHLSQKYIVSKDFDNGGVHLNATIYGHAFYLLAHGGRNSVSQVLVNGIGIDKAARIFYTAFVNYLTKHSDFMDAANALLEVAFSQYGGTSHEYQQTVRAMEAIGWIVN